MPTRLRKTLIGIACAVSVLGGAIAFAAGEQDPTFSGDGYTATDFGSDENARAVHVLSDGRILVGGGATNQGAAGFKFARYLPVGTLDPTFGSGGTTTITGTGIAATPYFTD